MNKNKSTILILFAIVSVGLIVTIITAYSTLLTQAINQAQAQSLNVTEQKSYVTDVKCTFQNSMYIYYSIYLLLVSTFNH